MGLMGLGGLVAVIGGLMFLVLVFRAMSRAAPAAGPAQRRAMEATE
jgi:hypothetical protein